MGLPDVLKIAFVLGFFVFGLTPLMVIVERRLSAFMQGRVGPDRVDFPYLHRLGGLLPGGLAQPLADAIKFIFKEDIIPDEADKLIYVMAPLMVLVPPALGLIVIPFGNQIGDVPLQVANLSVGVLFSMSVLSIAVYGLAFGGWASNNKYSLLGGLRASAQLVSYELALGLSIIAVLMMSAGHKSEILGTLDPRAIVHRQIEHGWNLIGGGNWWLFPSGVIGFILFFVSALAENNRLPFDLPECEAELVGGYHTEYSSMKFALFMMGEYVGMTVMAALMTTFFLGGWHFPGITNPESHTLIAGLLSVGVFVGKVVAILFVYVIIRWTLPRFKYNQLMDLGWKRLVPLALANVAAVAVIGVLTQSGGAR
ncbi:MAG: NADH-quinone oxidoreductase subunit H [Planctomycetes bacterium]|nr:NADH-quinone oxidoreductase subunit H [Planctomycetota bacterium]